MYFLAIFLLLFYLICVVYYLYSVTSSRLCLKITATLIYITKLLFVSYFIAAWSLIVGPITTQEMLPHIVNNNTLNSNLSDIEDALSVDSYKSISSRKPSIPSFFSPLDFCPWEFVVFLGVSFMVYSIFPFFFPPVPVPVPEKSDTLSEIGASSNFDGSSSSFVSSDLAAWVHSIMKTPHLLAITWPYGPYTPTTLMIDGAPLKAWLVASTSCNNPDLTPELEDYINSAMCSFSDIIDSSTIDIQGRPVLTGFTPDMFIGISMNLLSELRLGLPTEHLELLSTVYPSLSPIYLELGLSAETCHHLMVTGEPKPYGGNFTQEELYAVAIAPRELTPSPWSYYPHIAH